MADTVLIKTKVGFSLFLLGNNSDIKVFVSMDK